MMEFRLGKRNVSRTPTELQADSATVRYELDMLLDAAQEYGEAEATGNRVRQNTAVESFALHCRALIFFLFGHVKGLEVVGFDPEKFNEARDNDVLAWDYYACWQHDCPEPSDLLHPAKWQADKHVMHITTQRRGVNQPGTRVESVWRLREIVEEIARVMVLFLGRAPAGNFHPAELTRMKERLARRAAAGTAASTTPTVAMSGPQMPEVQAQTDARTVGPSSMINLYGKTR